MCFEINCLPDWLLEKNRGGASCGSSDTTASTARGKSPANARTDRGCCMTNFARAKSTATQGPNASHLSSNFIGPNAANGHGTKFLLLLNGMHLRLYLVIPKFRTIV